MNKLRRKYCEVKGFNFIDFTTLKEAEEYILYLECLILSKYQIDLKKEIKKHIERNNGKGSYDCYIGSAFESDIIDFIKYKIL